MKGVVAIWTQSIVDDSFPAQELEDLEETADISSQDSSTGNKAKVPFWVAPIRLDHEISVRLIELRSFVVLFGEELWKL